jgi:hypothetical protein
MCSSETDVTLSLSAHSTYTMNSECLFVIHFHTVSFTFAKFCMTAEGLSEEVLILWNSYFFYLRILTKFRKSLPPKKKKKFTYCPRTMRVWCIEVCGFKQSLKTEGAIFIPHDQYSKSKVVPVHNPLSTTSWRCMGDWRYSSTILDLSTMSVSGQLHAPAPLPPRKELQVPLDRMLFGLQSRSEWCGVEKIFPCQ